MSNIKELSDQIKLLFTPVKYNMPISGFKCKEEEGWEIRGDKSMFTAPNKRHFETE